MNRLTTDERAGVLACLVEGNSIRATVRITGIAKKTVSRFAVELGRACEKFMDKAMRNLPCTQIQCDEIWSFTYAKEKNVPDHLRGSGAGDTWTWVAIDPVTKLIPCFYVGDRTAQSAYKLMHNLQPRLANRVQLTTDGHRAYLIAVRAAWNAAPIDYGVLVKIYGDTTAEGRYSPGECIGTERTAVLGQPDRRTICTSHAERQNLTMRMQMRRFTRLTNGFSKKLENHKMACALYFVHYNFARIHQSLRVTPAMQAGLTDHVWSLAEIVNLLEAEEVALCA
jgi:IS1 family transposase